MKYRGYPGRDKVTLFVVDACLIAVAAVAGWYLPTGQMDHGSHQVLELLVVGRSNKEIGSVLGIEERTVKAHVAKLMRKVGVQNRIALSVHAITHSLVISSK